MLGCYEDIASHWGHDLEAVTYAREGEAPVNAAIECVTCGCVLVDFDNTPTPPEPEVRHEPLTTAELRTAAAADPQGFVTVLVAVDDSALIDGDLESFLDLLADKAVGSIALMEISYEPVGVTDDGCLIYQVTGNPEMVLADAVEEGN